MYNFRNKRKSVQSANDYMYARTLSMFEWEGLPDTIPQKELEKALQTHGYAFIFQHTDDNLYALTGGLGGTPDVYGNPTQIVITNPALKLNKTFDLVGSDQTLPHQKTLLILSDDLQLGLYPIFNKYNTFLVENELTMYIQGINSRVQTHLAAPTGQSYESAVKYLKDIENGDVGVIADTQFLEGVKSHSTSSSQGSMNALIELHQYFKASMFNEIGLNANYNMKRERLNSAEVDLNSDSILPFVDNMMKCRLEGVEKMNEIFGLDVKVGFGSAWYLTNEERVDGVVDTPTESTKQEEEKLNVDGDDDTPEQEHDVDGAIDDESDLDLDNHLAATDEEQEDEED